jgi:hypothetical protein
MKPSDLRTIIDHADPRWHLRPVLLALLNLWDSSEDSDIAVGHVGACGYVRDFCKCSCGHDALAAALKELEDLEE